MNYSENEVAPLYDEDFTGYFMGAIGPEDSKMDVITIVHYAISFDDAEKQKEIFEIETGFFLHIVPYHMLVEMKSRSRREKDNYDVVRLEEIRNKIK